MAVANMTGTKDKITSARLTALGSGTYQVEAAMRMHGFAVHIDNAETAKFLADLFTRAAEVLTLNESGRSENKSAP